MNWALFLAGIGYFLARIVKLFSSSELIYFGKNLECFLKIGYFLEEIGCFLAIIGFILPRTGYIWQESGFFSTWDKLSFFKKKE